MTIDFNALLMAFLSTTLPAMWGMWLTHKGTPPASVEALRTSQPCQTQEP